MILSELGIAGISGLVIGPAIGLLLSYTRGNIGFLLLDSYTCPGYIQTFITGIMLYNSQVWFRELERGKREGRKEMMRYRAAPDPMGLGVVYLMLLFAFVSFAVQETVITPIITDVQHRHSNTFSWGLYEAYALYCISGVFSCLSFIFFHTTSGKFDNRKLALVSTLLGSLGWVLMVDYEPREFNVELFFTGYFLVRISFIACRNVTLVVLSNVIGPNPAVRSTQGKYMGVSLSVWGLARMVAPPLAIESLRISTRFCFLANAAILLVSAGVQIGFAAHLRPHADIYKRKEEEIRKTLVDVHRPVYS